MTPAHELQELVDAGWAPSTHYLIVRLRRREIRGRKCGRRWVMSDSDVQAYIESLSNAGPQADVLSPRFGLSEASARRRAS
jgi:hypothetical protein